MRLGIARRWACGAVTPGKGDMLCKPIAPPAFAPPLAQDDCQDRPSAAPCAKLTRGCRSLPGERATTLAHSRQPLRVSENELEQWPPQSPGMDRTLYPGPSPARCARTGVEQVVAMAVQQARRHGAKPLNMGLRHEHVCV